MRIIAGYLKSRIIIQPPLGNTRPTSDRVRESVFNMLNHQLLLNNQNYASLNVLDLFAGSGAMGFEAISRGCLELTAIDRNIDAVNVLRSNADILGIRAKVSILRMDALKLRTGRRQYSLVFLDPPYNQDLIAKTLNVLKDNNWLAHQAIIVCESSRDEILKLSGCFSICLQRTFNHCNIHIISYNKLD